MKKMLMALALLATGSFSQGIAIDPLKEALRTDLVDTVVTPDTTGRGHGHAAAGAAPSLLPAPDSAAPAAALAKVRELEAVAILHEGRVKPMVTFARHLLLQLSGKTTYQKSSAMQVLARVLFAPEGVSDYRIFLINNPEVAEAMGIPPEKHRRYTLRELEKGLAKLQNLAEKADAVEPEKRTLVDKEVLRVYANLVQFVSLARSFSYTLPSPIFTVRIPETKSALELPAAVSRFSFWELMSKAPRIAQVLQDVGDRPEARRSPLENEIINLSQAMYLSSQNLHPSSLLILPTAGDQGSGWISPPEAVAVPGQLQVFNPELAAWFEAIRAYREGRQGDFDQRIASFKGQIENRAYGQLQGTHFPLEILYQHAEPFYRSLVLYWLALLSCFAFFLLRKPWLYQAALWLCLAGYALHVAAIVSRILIMKRPPVTSLYETFPFVAAVSILAALFLERVHRRRPSAGIGLVSASLLGVILLSIANRYAAEGDTLKMLVAVLNSNFWLSTHVICVTVGYSACLLAGAIGHIYLVRALLPGTSAKADRLKEIAKMIYGTLCFGLLFSFIGTVLGGIWADQSWGRFWGWDPKENGALLIVIWCIFLLHAKQWGYIQNRGLAQGSVFGAIVVALAWFGVNLLNVGLHSYGFTDGAQTKLFAYIGAELLFMGGTALALKLGVGSKISAMPV